MYEVVSHTPKRKVGDSNSFGRAILSTVIVCELCTCWLERWRNLHSHVGDCKVGIAPHRHTKSKNCRHPALTEWRFCFIRYSNRCSSFSIRHAPQSPRTRRTGWCPAPKIWSAAPLALSRILSTSIYYIYWNAYITIRNRCQDKNRLLRTQQSRRVVIIFVTGVNAWPSVFRPSGRMCGSSPLSADRSGK